MRFGAVIATMLALTACGLRPPTAVWGARLSVEEGFDLDAAKHADFQTTRSIDNADVVVVPTVVGPRLIPWRGATIYGPIDALNITRRCGDAEQVGMIAPAAPRNWAGLTGAQKKQRGAGEWFCIVTSSGRTLTIHFSGPPQIEETYRGHARTSKSYTIWYSYVR